MTHLGLFQFLRIPYGLKTAPQTFQRILNTIFNQFLYRWSLIYINDIVVWSNHPDEALTQHKTAFQHALEFGLQFKPSKYFFFSRDLEILGHRNTPQGRYPTTKGTEVILKMPRPHNVKVVRRFIGMVGYFREYIKDMSMRIYHLRALHLFSGHTIMKMSSHISRLLFVLATEHTLLRMFLNIWRQFCFRETCIMMLFRISVQLSVKPLICPQGLQLPALLSNYQCTFTNYKAYPT